MYFELCPLFSIYLFSSCFSSSVNSFFSVISKSYLLICSYCLLTIVAIENNEIVGFGDIDESGYLDRLFVHREHQREGIASAICDKLEQAVSIRKITTHSSITARPFFEHRGYRVIREQTVIRNGIALTNFIMEK